MGRILLGASVMTPNPNPAQAMLDRAEAQRSDVEALAKLVWPEAWTGEHDDKGPAFVEILREAARDRALAILAAGYAPAETTREMDNLVTALIRYQAVHELHDDGLGMSIADATVAVGARVGAFDEYETWLASAQQAIINGVKGLALGSGHPEYLKWVRGKHPFSAASIRALAQGGTTGGERDGG